MKDKVKGKILKIDCIKNLLNHKNGQDRNAFVYYAIYAILYRGKISMIRKQAWFVNEFRQVEKLKKKL